MRLFRYCVFLMNISEDTQECHNHEAQHYRGVKRMRDEEQIIKKQTPHMKLPTHKQRRTATEVPPWNGQLLCVCVCGGGGGCKPVSLSRNLTLVS